MAPGFRVTPGPAGFGFVLPGDQDLLDHYRVFNAGDDFHGAAAAAAGLDVDIENTLEPLRPCHRRSPLCWCCRFISHPDLVALPRFAGVTNARCRLLGANTPWKRVRLTLGFGTGAASLAMKSNGSKMTCVVPSRYGVLSW